MSNSQAKKRLDYVLDNWNAPTTMVSIYFVEGNKRNAPDTKQNISYVWISVVMHNHDEYQIYLDKTSITVDYAHCIEYTNNGIGNDVMFDSMCRNIWINVPTFLQNTKNNTYTLDHRGNAEIIMFNSYYNILLEHIEDIMCMSLEEFTKDTIKYKVNP